MIQDCLQSEDRNLGVHDSAWLEGSNIYSLRNACDHAAAFGISLDPPVVQATVRFHIECALPQFDLSDFILKRASRFLHTDDIDVQHIIDGITGLCSTFKPCVDSAYIFSLFNGWCTRRRFGKPDLGCVICEHSDFGGIEHLLICPAIQKFLKPFAEGIFT